MLPMKDKDLRKVVDALPEEVREVLRLNPKVLLAGGFIRDVLIGEEPKDADLFGPEWPFKEKVKGRVLKSGVVEVVSLGKYPVQWIPMESPFGHVEFGFDLTCCQATVGWSQRKNTWTGYVGQGFYEDCGKKLLQWANPVADHSERAYRHMAKLSERGWRIPIEKLGVFADLMRAFLRPENEDDEITEQILLRLCAQFRDRVRQLKSSEVDSTPVKEISREDRKEQEQTYANNRTNVALYGEVEGEVEERTEPTNTEVGTGWARRFIPAHQAD